MSALSNEKWLTDLTRWSDRAVLFDATLKRLGAVVGVRWSQPSPLGFNFRCRQVLFHSLKFSREQNPLFVNWEEQQQWRVNDAPILQVVISDSTKYERCWRIFQWDWVPMGTELHSHPPNRWPLGKWTAFFCFFLIITSGYAVNLTPLTVFMWGELKTIWAISKSRVETWCGDCGTCQRRLERTVWRCQCEARMFHPGDDDS